MPCLIVIEVSYIVWREFNYFRPGGSYYVGLSAQGVTMSTTFRRRFFAWSEIEPFFVSGGHSENGKHYFVRAVRKDGGWFRRRVSIPQKDFAKRVGAEILCDFLNQVRSRVQEAGAGGTPVTVSVPDGLNVVERSDSGAPPEDVPPPATGDYAKHMRNIAKPVHRTTSVTRD